MPLIRALAKIPTTDILIVVVAILGVLCIKRVLNRGSTLYFSMSKSQSQSHQSNDSISTTIPLGPASQERSPKSSLPSFIRFTLKSPEYDPSNPISRDFTHRTVPSWTWSWLYRANTQNKTLALYYLFANIGSIKVMFPSYLEAQFDDNLTSPIWNNPSMSLCRGLELNP